MWAAQAFLLAFPGLVGCGKCQPFVGAEIVYETSADTPARVEALIKDRVQERRLDDVQVLRVGRDIVVRVPGADDEARTRITDLLILDRSVGLHLVVDNPTLMRSLAQRLGGVDAERARALGLLTQGGAILAIDRVVSVLVDAARRMGCYAEHQPVIDGQVECMIWGRKVLADYLSEVAQRDPTLAPGPGEMLVIGFLDGLEADAWTAYHVERPPMLAGTNIAWAELEFEADTQRPLVVVELTSEGAHIWAHATRVNQGRQFALLVGDMVHEVFGIEAVAQGKVFVLGLPRSEPLDEARRVFDLLGVLRAGVPLGIRLVSSRIIGTPSR